MKMHACWTAGLCALVLSWAASATADDKTSSPGQFTVTDVHPQEASPFKPEPLPGIINLSDDNDGNCQDGATATAPNTAAACGGKDCGCDACRDACCCGPSWTFDADGIFLTRSAARERPLLLDATQIGNPVLLTGHDLNFSDYEAGPQLSATRHFQSGWDVEFRYFQVDGWRSSSYAAGVNDVLVGDNEAVTSQGTSVAYGSALYSGELLVHRQLTYWLNASAGFRMLEVDDKLTTSGNDPLSGENIFTGTRAFNHLYGLQFGADASLFKFSNRFSLDGIAKMGFYDNHITQSSTISVDQQLQDAVHDSADHTAFVGEFGLMAKYQISRHLAARGGYEVLYMDGVGLAPEQIDKNDYADNTAGVNTHGHLWCQGATLGFEVNW